MRRKHWLFIILIGLFAFSLMVYTGCSTGSSGSDTAADTGDTTDGDTDTGDTDGTDDTDDDDTVVSPVIRSYGGSDPEGDFVVIINDVDNSRVKRIDYTAGETEDSVEWYDYTAVEPDDEFASGFSMLNRAEIDSDTFVLFAEFPEVALIYQVFDESGDDIGNPSYVVYREELDKTELYEKAYNWMKFYIDGDLEDSDMSAGFCGFDAQSEEGLVYGAAYSKRENVFEEGYEGSGVSDINEGDVTKLDDFTYDEETESCIMWGSAVENWDEAITLTGTDSGSIILDFGPDMGGGMGLAVPQMDDPADSEWWSSGAGTYFAMMYELDKGDGESSVNPMKLVITDTGRVKVYQYNDSIASGTPVFNQQLIAFENFNEGPNDERIEDTFGTVSGNDEAVSSAVNNAHKCRGAFIAHDEEDDVIVTALIDPDGRFGGFTLFDDEEEETDYILRFGFYIRDSGYTDPE